MRVVLRTAACAAMALLATVANAKQCASPVSRYVDAGTEFQHQLVAASDSCSPGTPVTFVGAAEGWQVTSNGLVTYNGASDSSLTVERFCGSTSECEQTLRVYMVAPLTSAATSEVTEAPAAPAAERCREAYGFSATSGTPLTSSLASVPFASSCGDGEAQTFALTSMGVESVQLASSGAFTFSSDIIGFHRFDFAMSCNGAVRCTGTAHVEVSAAPITAAPPLNCDASVIATINASTSVPLPHLPCAGAQFEKPAWVSVSADDVRVVGREPGQWHNFTVQAQCPGGVSCGLAFKLFLIRPMTEAPQQSNAPVTASPTTPHVVDCSGTCGAQAWASTPFRPEVWGPAPRGTATVAGDDSITITATGTVGNMAVTFPSFDNFAVRGRLEPSNIESGAASVPFKMECLSKQAPFGVGEQVWAWSNLSSLEGQPAAGYHTGESYYQKFGGKHQQCDTFDAPCKYAPMLTPRPGWALSIRGCESQWSSTMNVSAASALKRSDGSRVFTSTVRQNSISSEASLNLHTVRPVSWVRPDLGVEVKTTTVPVKFDVSMDSTATVQDDAFVAAGTSFVIDAAQSRGLLSVLLVPTALRPAPVTEVRTTSAAFIPASIIDAQPTSTFVCRGDNTTSFGTCPQLALRPELGPVSMRPCPLSKPFSPSGVAGISDTTCDVASTAAHALNLTLWVPLPRDGTLATMPAGQVVLDLVSATSSVAVTINLKPVLLKRGTDVAVERCSGFPLNPFDNVPDVSSCTPLDGFAGPSDVLRVSFATNDTIVGASVVSSGATRQILSPGQSFANARVHQGKLVFVPLPLCSEPHSCRLRLEIVAKNGRRSTTQIFVDSRLGARLHNGTVAASSDFFFAILDREDGGVDTSGFDSDQHAALGLAFLLFAAIFILGALTVYTNESAQAVVSEHGRVASHYIKKFTGVQLASSKPSEVSKKPKKPTVVTTAVRMPKGVQGA